VANSLSGTTWKCDTVGVLSPGQVAVKSFYWLAPVADGDVLIVKDNAGRVVLHAIAEAAGQSQYFYKGGKFWVPGLTLDTLTSGTLFIDIR
jgi:hypothetical protein